MIRYVLKCDDDHAFESWFASAEAFERLKGARQVTCAVCGSAQVEKALMAPTVRTPDAPAPRLDEAKTKVETVMAAWRKKIEAESDYVGLSFAAEARAMHDGDKPHRMIHGEARIDEAKALIEDGVPVAPLPFLPRRQTH